MEKQRETAAHFLILLLAAMALTVVSASPLLAQAGRPASPTPPPNQAEIPSATEIVNRKIDVPSPATRINPVRRVPRPSLMMRTPANLETLKKNLDELQEVTARLQMAIAGGSPDYPSLVTNAEMMQRLARCVQSATGLRTSTSGDSRSPESKEMAAEENLRRLVSGIDQAVKEFANSAVAQQSKTIDAQLMGEAGLALDKIVTLSLELRKQADVLSKSLETSQSLAGSTRSKRSYKRPPYLQLTVDCSIWSADLFSRQSATAKKDQTLKIEGVDVQMNHHQLAERQLISLEECMPCSFDEKAFAAGEQYAVLLKDFYSYEVKERTFAYQVTYEVVRTKNGKISSRLVQPVTLFFIDAGGQGEFELAQGNRALASLPEWVRELVPSRWAAASRRD